MKNFHCNYSWPLFIVITFLYMACNQTQDELFPQLNQQEEVMLRLAKYGLEKVPPQVNEFKNAAYLSITKDTTNQWKTGPPFSAFANENFDPQPPFEYLPNEILELTQLKELHLNDLNLRSLPEDLYQLKNLEHLDVSVNKLDIAAEIPKLKKMKNLKRIDVYLNKIDTVAIQMWQQDNPELQINYH